MKEEKFPNPLTGRSVGNFGISEGNITGKKNKRNKKSTDYMPNRNSQQRNSPDAYVHHQQVRAEEGGAGCMLRVRTGPECPEGNLREVT